MEKRRLGTSDLQVTPVVLGAWAIGGSMWGGQDERDAIAAIHASLDLGINFIDTAAVYGMGRSEEIVGKALRDRRDRALVATKCGLIWDSTEGTFKFEMIDVDGRPRAIHHDLRPPAVRAGCEASLRRLGREVIDLYQIHWPDPGLPIEDSFGELLRLREEGKIRWIGVSNFSAQQLRVAKRVAGIVSDQPQYNLLDRGIETEILPLCAREQLGVIAYSPMGRGLLSGKFGAGHQFAANDHRGGLPWFKPKTLPRVQAALEQARPMASAYGVSLANLAVAWVTSAPGITAAIVGARDAAQATENARAAAIRLADADRATLTRLFASFSSVATAPTIRVSGND
jgi:aryl-alcohol dehydrogenase-like predicted oxidoreductase